MPGAIQAIQVAESPPETELVPQDDTGRAPMSSGGNMDDAAYGDTGIVPAFYRIRDVIRMTALKRATLYRRIAAGRFPPPVHLGGRVCAWPRAALQAWIADPEHYRVPATSKPMARRSRGRPRKYAAS